MKQTIKILSHLLLSFFLCSSVLAAELIPSQAIPNLNLFFKQVEQTGILNYEHCDTSPPHSQNEISCIELAESACKKLWNQDNNGHLETELGVIQVGKSDRSELSYPQKMDLEAWVASESRLPKELRQNLSPILKDLGRMLERENKSPHWHQQLAAIVHQLKDTVNRSADQRVKQSLPELSDTQTSEPTTAQQGKHQGALLDFQNEILRAKYEEHPNWKRVERMFKQAKEDLLATIQDLDIPDPLRKKLKTKIDSVGLSLPYSDPRKLTAPGSCSTTEKNAFYSPVYNLFTVCAGLFNSLQTDPNLYIIIAHELSHSIDPETIILDEYKNSEIGRAVKDLTSSNKPAFSCEEWRKLSQKIFKLQDDLTEPIHPYSKLNDCLAPLSEPLRPFTSANLHPITKRQTSNLMNKYAASNSFTLLSQQQINKNGRMVDNEFYLHPDRLESIATGGIYIPENSFYTAIPAIFVQSLLCQEEIINGNRVDFEHASGRTRQILFEQALIETRNSQQAIYESIFSRCGKECSGLVIEGLSRNAQERFADWMASQALPRYLNSESSLKKRREMLAIAITNLCFEQPSATSNAPDLLEIEQKYSLDSHPDQRLRSHSIFTPAVSKSVKCKVIDELKKGFGECTFSSAY